MQKSFFIPSLILCLGTVFVSAQSSVLLELNFPYATKWSQPVNSGLGNGLTDFNGDGQRNDVARGLKCTTPQDPEYLGTQNFTNPGPQLVMRGVLAHLDNTTLQPPERLSSHGVTKQAIRLEGTRRMEDMSSNMGYVGWWYVPSQSFSNGGRLASFASGGRIEATSIVNDMGIVWRVLVKNDGKYYISDVGSDTKNLSIDDIASTNWVLYRHAEAGLGMRLRVDTNAVVSGRDLTQIEGVGVYAELIGFDGTTMSADDRVLLDVNEFTVTLN